MDTSWNIYIYIFNQFNCATFLCLLWATTWISNTMSWTFFVFNYLKCNGCSFSYWWHCRPSLFILTVHIHVRTTMDNYLWENLVISVRAIVVVIVYQNWWCEFKFLNCSASYYQKGFFLITRDESFPLISRFPSFFKSIQSNLY
jgi:hypothetical protein